MPKGEFGWNRNPEPAGFLDKFDGVVETAVFQEGDYGVQMVLSIKNLDPDYAGENQLAWYSLGKGDFVVLDGGLRVGGAQFKENSKIDLLVKSALKCEAKLPPGDEASVWEGMTFHWERKTMSEVSGRKIKIGDREPMILVPTKYLGKRDVTEETGSAGSDSDEAVQNALLDTLEAAKASGKGPLKWPALMMLSINQHEKGLKAAIATRGASALSSLVAAECVSEENGAYSFEMRF